MAITAQAICSLQVIGDGVSTSYSFNLHTAPLVLVVDTFAYPSAQAFGGALPVPSSLAVSASGSVVVTGSTLDQFGNVTVTFAAAFSSAPTLTLVFQF